MKKFSRFYLFRSRTICSALVVAVTALFLVPDAIACHQTKGEPRPHGKQTTCDDGQKLPPGEVTVTAWFNDQFFSAPDQPFSRSPDSSLESGDYLPGSPGLEDVLISTTTLSKTVVRGKRDADLCQIMDQSSKGPFVAKPETFNFGWMDNCTDGRCDVEISMSFGAGVAELTSGRSDRLEILMHGSVADDDLQFVAEPFLLPQRISTTSIELDFKKPQSTRSLVLCRLGPQGRGSPILNTDP